MTVYFIIAKPSYVVKIGHTGEPIKRRLEDLQVANHEDLQVIRLVTGMRRVELFYHHKYKALRISPRREWFRFCDDMLVLKPPAYALRLDGIEPNDYEERCIRESSIDFSDL
jgi:hypothetical protein